MNFNELNELEKIGLAFISGVIAGTSIEKVEEKSADENEENIKTGVVKLEGEKAKEFMNFIENLTNGGKK
jgi:hypothetical protein